MPFPVTFQTISTWISEVAAEAVVGAAETLESSQLLDTIANLCDITGATGAVFRLGRKLIPHPTPEQRITSELHRTLLKSLDREFARSPELISRDAWRQYVRDHIKKSTESKLGHEFTWLRLLGKRAGKPSRSWPIVGELADLGRAWIIEAATLNRRTYPKAQQYADDARGRIYEELLATMSKLLAESLVLRGIEDARFNLQRQQIEILATELATLKSYMLFGEIPQHTVYIPPDLKIWNYAETLGVHENQPTTLTRAGDKRLLEIITEQKPPLIIIEGDMGSGKSCLMRTLTSYLATRYLSLKNLAPIYVRWRDIYSEPDKITAIEYQLNNEYGLSNLSLAEEEDIIFMIDGFDEMSSHQETYLSECLESLIRMTQKGATVVVSMRTTVVTPSLRYKLRNSKATGVEVQPFDNSAIDLWARRWAAKTGAQEVTGDRLRSLCRYSGKQNVAQNPLLLYMLAKYVGPTEGENRQPLTRTEIFRIFVDETIRGKFRSTKEDFPIAFPEDRYRLLLQEIAYISSFPRFTPKAPAFVIRDFFRELNLSEDLHFDDFKTAFVLHFFEPTDVSASEFEFQPEGFRQYLLAEWCVRAQIEALRDESRFSRPLTRTRNKAIGALSQFPLREEERLLLNEIYEDLGRLASQNSLLLSSRLAAFGIETTKDNDELNLVRKLRFWVTEQAEHPPLFKWEDEKVGVPEGQILPPGLCDWRLQFNFWDQCMIGALGLYRGTGVTTTSTVFEDDPTILGRFMRAWHVVRGFSRTLELNLSRLGLSKFDLRNTTLEEVDLRETALRGGMLERAILVRAKLDRSLLEDANLEGIDASGATLTEAYLQRANLNRAKLVRADLSEIKAYGAYMEEADLRGANLRHAVLREAHLHSSLLSGADMEHSELSLADLAGSDLREISAKRIVLNDANLEGSDLRGAYLVDAKLIRAVMNRADFSGDQTVLSEAYLTNASLVGANFEGADLGLADLAGADMRGANLRNAKLGGANLEGTDLRGACLEGALVTKEQLAKAILD